MGKNIQKIGEKYTKNWGKIRKKRINFILKLNKNAINETGKKRSFELRQKNLITSLNLCARMNVMDT